MTYNDKMKLSSRLVSKNQVPRRDDVIRCSFCGKAQDEVSKLIAGPKVYICDECVRVCQDIIEHEHQEHKTVNPPDHYAPVSCSLCGMLTPPSSALLLENRGLLCPVCLDAIQAAVTARDERDQES